MKIKSKIIASITTAMLLSCSMSAFAEVHTPDPAVKFIDEVCGYVNITPSYDTDVYVKIIKHTPESGEEGYIVYDSVIKAAELHIGDTASFPLEYNNYSPDSEKYDGSYDVMIGVHKTKGSDDPDDIAYVSFDLLVCDINYCGFETFCNIEVALTKDELETPVAEAVGESTNMSYKMTFQQSDPKPTEPPKQEAVLGDANGDGGLSVVDAVYIAKALSQKKADTLPDAADFNQDGRKNVMDAVAIASTLAGAKR